MKTQNVPVQLIPDVTAATYECIMRPRKMEAQIDLDISSGGPISFQRVRPVSLASSTVYFL